jgi:hypothetical protein
MAQYKLDSIKNGQSRETGNIGYTRRRKTKQKHNTIYVDHHYAKTNTNNVNKACASLQTTGGKDEPTICFYPEIITDITTRMMQSLQVFLEELYSQCVK